MTNTLPQCKQILSGWGNTPIVECATYRPEKQRQIKAIYAENESNIITRGNGMSYGDASLNADGVILTGRLNHFLSFDKTQGVLRMQAGVTLADIMELVIPYGWFLPVIPGTKHATIGGCVACNVHGKNHFNEGEIASHITDIILRLPSGEAIHCSPYKDADIFWATAGGMGMTGSIEEVSLQLMPITSSALETQTVQVPHIEAMLEEFETHLSSSDYMVGWIDHFAKGKSLGKGVFERANHIEAPGGTPTPMQMLKQKVSVPCFMPGFLLNKYSMAMYNTSRFSNVEKYPTDNIQDFDSFFHPLDTIGHWNRLYGKKGFLQYQCLIPRSPQLTEQVHGLLEMIQQSGLFSFLAVIKYHGNTEGMLTFSTEGVSIALDFPNNRRVRMLLRQLDEYLLTVGGRVYLAKDARLKQEHFDQMYAEGLARWRPVIQSLDPAMRCHSAMAERLGFHGGV